MRKKFTELLPSYMEKDKNIYFITADLGYKLWDKIEQNTPDNIIKMGASEQLMLGAAVGLAYSGKIPICYSISTFLINRPFEWLRNYVNYENLPVKLVGSGRDKDYSHDGKTHWADDDEQILAALPNIKILKPNNEQELEEAFHDFIYSITPIYLNLKRS
jgi:transketolase